MQKIPIVKDFMSTKLVTVTETMEIFTAINLLLDHKISGAPVVDRDGHYKKLVGVLTAKDCMSILANGAFYDLPAGKVHNYMSRKLTTITPDKDIFAAAEIFLRKSFRRIPVVEEDILIGVVTRGDVLKASRKLWQNQHAPDAPDSGYINDRLKAKLGETGITHIHKKLG